ncbi:hypothetical protein T4D_9585 [Trichinella pseudospiralis]|uniref:Uncharacterized protein n=1 Tax=Trichinella pseudospiralis TaxID=6337 RepID=A0A0V1FZK4_TRIPS|nr:hypothetical protein T4D_9585 [Trichinella pseudospiralis]
MIAQLRTNNSFDITERLTLSKVQHLEKVMSDRPRERGKEICLGSRSFQLLEEEVEKSRHCKDL